MIEMGEGNWKLKIGDALCKCQTVLCMVKPPGQVGILVCWMQAFLIFDVSLHRRDDVVRCACLPLVESLSSDSSVQGRDP